MSTTIELSDGLSYQARPFKLAHKISHLVGKPQTPDFLSPSAVASGCFTVVVLVAAGTPESVPLVPGSCSAFSPEAAESASQPKLTLETAW